jgi:hypothetical protein
LNNGRQGKQFFRAAVALRLWESSEMIEVGFSAVAIADRSVMRVQDIERRLSDCFIKTIEMRIVNIGPKL